MHYLLTKARMNRGISTKYASMMLRRRYEDITTDNYSY